MVLPDVEAEPAGPGDGADEAPADRVLLREVADALGPAVDGAVADDGVLEDHDLFLERRQHALDLGPDLRGDVPADAADEDHAVGLAVAGDPLREPHDLLPDAPGLHEDRVEADEVAGDAEPEEMGVEALDLEHDRPDVLGPPRDPMPAADLDGLGVADGVDRAADAADPLGDEGDLVVADLGLAELLDAPMGHEAAVVAALDRFAVDVDGEVLRLVEADVERARRGRSSSPAGPRRAGRRRPRRPAASRL